MSTDPDFDAETLRNHNDRIADLTPPREPQRTSSEKPQAYIIGGQPAAGKSTTQERIFRSLPRGTVASYDGDDNATIHPQYEELMRAHGKDGQDVVSKQLSDADHSYHGEYMKHLRGENGGPQYDVIASHPLGREDWADGWVDGFADQGYETSVVFVSTHESNSRLGIAHRYQEQRDDPDWGYGRWVDPNLHDQFYSNGPDVAHHLEENARADHIYVVNRDGQLLHENHRKPDGTMENGAGARDAIIAERNRTPTAQEEERFNRTVEYMRSTDPRIHPEPVDSETLGVVDTAVAQREQLRSRATATGDAAPEKRSIDETLLSRGQTGNPEQTPQTREGATNKSTAASVPSFLGRSQAQSASGSARTTQGSPQKPPQAHRSGQSSSDSHRRGHSR